MRHLNVFSVISGDGTEHCGYLVVKGCSIGDFWFDLYKGTWEANDENTKSYLDREDVGELLSKKFSDVAVCMGPTYRGVDGKEVWRSIIALHCYGDVSRRNEIEVMSQCENAQLVEAAKYPSTTMIWDVKTLSGCLAS